MKTSRARDMRALLLAWSDRDQSALEKLASIVYDELRRLPRHYMRQERPGHSLQTTALVNEAYLRLVDYKRIAGTIAPTSLPFQRDSCGEFWSTMHGVTT